ncbi:hypothetical protein MIMGU_mgv1a016499mg [Erythranthe guttata]|uniref:Uncharacterized protein n=1 Tax=Erythranthe guttata TaxID=4155 RepID=A0A022RZG1_ERYGU|nr:hypothetical protein MIMGU_mgv1a016499mg [Erythranthe guttata]
MASKVNIVITQLAILVVSANLLEACFLTTEYRVLIDLDLSLGFVYPLTIHCWSGNEDLGTHMMYLADGITKYDWRFYKTFQVFNSDTSDHDCAVESTCTWHVKKHGFYLNGNDRRSYKW